MIDAQSLETIAVATSAVLQLFVLIEMKRASAVALKAVEFSVKGILFATCPVLTLRRRLDGGYGIENCGRGPAIMVQWGYGSSVPVTKVLERIDDNIIPAGAMRPINLDLAIARVSGVQLFAYGPTNDKYVTSIRWQDDSETIVHFGPYEGKLKNEV